MPAGKIYKGTELNDLLFGTSGDDSIYGYAGNDQINPGSGADLVEAGDGDDVINKFNLSGSSTLLGGLGNDTVWSGDGNDRLEGGPGNDSLDGGAGNDTLLGSDGNDTLWGGVGNDWLEGGSGRNRIVTGDGEDSVWGGSEDDEINGYLTANGYWTFWNSTGTKRIAAGDGNDFAYGGSDADSISGGAGNDYLVGGAGDDRLQGEEGNDTLYGEDGNDTLEGGEGDGHLDGGAGNDSLVGGAGNDSIDGWAGNDTLIGGSGNNTLNGGDGNDLLVVSSGQNRLLTGDGLDSVIGGSGNDEINGYLLADGSWTHWNAIGAKLIAAGDGNDFVYGGSDADTIAGGAGNDYVVGGGADDLLQGDGGNDTLNGGDGKDSIDGGDGSDSLDGGSGNDTLIGGAGNDTLSGGADNDSLEGGAGRNELYGGAGNDTLVGGVGHSTLNGGQGDDVYYIDNANQFIDDAGGNDTAYVSADFVKVPSTVERVIYVDGAQALPYWIDALLPDAANGRQFSDLLGEKKTFAYVFPTSLPAYDNSISDARAWAPFTAVQQTRTKEALNYISSVLDLTFVSSDDPAASNTLTFANNQQFGSSGYAYYPGTSLVSSDVFLDSSSKTGNALISDGTYSSLTLVHEIGHALGLEHPFGKADSAGGYANLPNLPSAEDNTQWTVMSYTDSSTEYHLRYSPLDIAALQYIYGPSKTARAGNDEYAISALEPNFVWDGGGVDLISAASCPQGCTIYLTPGYWGYVGSSKGSYITQPGQITVNFGTVIENLTGSSFADQLFGNEVNNQIKGGNGDDVLNGEAGDDVLVGGAGNDSLDGGQGTDTAVWGSKVANYQLSKVTGGWTVKARTGLDGTDSLSAIERLQFADKTVIVESQAHGSYADLPVGLYQFFITAFGAAPGVTYMDQLAEAYRYGLSLRQIVDIFTTKSQFTDLYPTGLSHEQLAQDLVKNIVKNSASDAVKQSAVKDIIEAMDVAHWTVGQVIYQVFGNLSNFSYSDPTWGNTAKQFANEIAVARMYTDTLNQSTTDMATLRSVITPVSHLTDVSTPELQVSLIGQALMT